jgi:hypothetical protein
MKTIALALAGTLVVATPAMAQGTYGSYRDNAYERSIDALQYRLDEGIRRGTITRSDATRFNDQVWQIRRLESQYARNGFNDWERTDLDRRISFLQEQLRGSDDRYGGRGGAYDHYSSYDDYRSDGGSAPASPDDDYGYGDDYPGQDQYGYPDDGTSGIQTFDPDSDYVPLDNLGTPDPDYPDSYDDPVGQWDDAAPGADAGDYGGVPEDALQVGDTAPPYLGDVPPQLRSLYREGSGLTYRFDGERIYQIDTRTNRIRWIGELR